MRTRHLATTLLVLAAQLPIATWAATILVTSTADSGPGTLRAALASAADGDTIDATGVSGRIRLANGVLVVSNSVTILGPGSDRLAVDGNVRSTVFLFTGQNTIVSMSDLTIANGYAFGYGVTHGQGGGIWSSASALILSNCAVIGNRAIYEGGGIFHGQGTLTIAGSTISSNTAFGAGGGIFNGSSAGTNSTVVITDSVLGYNSASVEGIALGQGGGIWSDASALSLSNCAIIGNRAFEDGGGIFQGQGTLTIVSSTISSNAATYGAGGGIFNGSSADTALTLVIADSVLSYNQAGGGRGGGGIYSPYGTVSITKTTISSNTASGGGGIFSGSSASTNSTVVIADSILSYNQASSFGGGGGGIFSFFGALRITNCFFSFNFAAGGRGFGGGIWANGWDLQVADSTFNSNSATFGGGIWNGARPDRSGPPLILNSTLFGNLARQGGGIYNASTLTVSNCNLSYNAATQQGDLGGGGGIYNAARMQIINSTLRSNRTGNEGGGIFNTAGSLLIYNSALSSNGAIQGGGIYNTATLIVSNCTLNYNATPTNGYGYGGSGGGIYNRGYDSVAVVQIVNSTLSGNQAGAQGGAIFNKTDYSAAFLQILNSTLSGNQAGAQGGAIFHTGRALLIYNSTLSSNWALAGGCIYVLSPAQLGSTIFNAGPLDGSIEDDFHQALSLGYNLSSDDGGGVLTNSTDLINTDPMLGPLQDNGGPTWTHALLCGSPAIDQGTNFLSSPYDQRGAPFNRTFGDPFVPKPSGGDGTDIGAFEVQTSCLTPAQAVGRLIDLVSSQWSPAQPLRATLSAARASIERGNPTTATNQLEAFQNQVQAKVMPSNPVLGGTMLQLAQVVINMLNGD